jgi:hypothetical protein
LSRLREATRAELGKVLPPEALEEYLLRYSQEAIALREQLRGFDTSPGEFRALFRALDPVDRQLAASDARTDPVSVRQRDQVQRDRTEAMRAVLGAERYDQYRLTQDPLYRQARDVTQQSGVTADKILPLAALYRLTELEEQRIQRDLQLSAEDRAARLEAARLAQQSSLRQLLGDAAYERYVRSQSQ